MSEMFSRAAHRFEFSGQETWWLIVTAFVAAFSLTLYTGYGVFDVFPGDSSASFSQNLPKYLLNLAVIFGFAIISLFIMMAAQKLAGLKLGYQTTFIPSLTVSVVMFFVTLVSAGYIPLFFPGAVKMDIIPKLRLGIFRGGIKHSDLAIISFSGALATLIAVLPLSALFLATRSAAIKAFIMVLCLSSLYSLIPIVAFQKFPNMKGASPGFFMIVNRRTLYVLALSAVLAFTLFATLNFFSYLASLVIGVVISVVYYNSFESSRR